MICLRASKEAGSLVRSGYVVDKLVSTPDDDQWMRDPEYAYDPRSAVAPAVLDFTIIGVFL